MASHAERDQTRSGPSAVNASSTEQARSLPLLDLSDFLSDQDSRKHAFVDRLREAAHETGFFYLRGHGLSPQEMADVFHLARQFFNLPPERKLSLHMSRSPHFRGYTAAGDEITRGARDWREQLDLGAERESLPWGDASTAWQRLQGPNQWPPELPALREAVLNWQQRLSAAAQSLLRALALALAQPEDCFDAAFGDLPVLHSKLIRYPGQVPGRGEQGVGAHKDSGFLTLLQQDQQGGLQVQLKGQWLDVPPVPGSLVVNLGESLELRSGGFLRATVHRVRSPASGTDRVSAAFFFGPRLDAELPALSLPPALAARACGVDLDPLNPLIPHAGHNFLKGRLRSHPEVAQAFYQDVLGHST